MNRRDFLAAISAAYGITLLPPRVYRDDLDFVAQTEKATSEAHPQETVVIPVALIDEQGRECLPQDVRFTLERIRSVDGHEALLFKAAENPTWLDVREPRVIARIAALLPFGATAHRVYFPIDGPVYTNGGNVTVCNLKAILT